MTIKEFYETNWHRGNEVRLNNGKEYLVKGTKGHGRFLLLFSEEYEKCFIADYKIVDCRTSDYEEPEEVYLLVRGVGIVIDFWKERLLKPREKPSDWNASEKSRSAN